MANGKLVNLAWIPRGTINIVVKNRPIYQFAAACTSVQVTATRRGNFTRYKFQLAREQPRDLIREAERKREGERERERESGSDIGSRRFCIHVPVFFSFLFHIFLFTYIFFFTIFFPRWHLLEQRASRTVRRCRWNERISSKLFEFLIPLSK